MGKRRHTSTAGRERALLTKRSNRVDDKHNFKQKDRNHGKFYAGKFHHSIHPNWHVQSFRDTCPPMAREDYRNADYQFWAKDHLRATSELDPKWQWGKAVPPTKVDVCKY